MPKIKTFTAKCKYHHAPEDLDKQVNDFLEQEGIELEEIKPPTMALVRGQPNLSGDEDIRAVYAITVVYKHTSRDLGSADLD